MTGQDNNSKIAARPPAEIADFLRKIGPRQLTAAEARELNLLRLKHGLPGASATGIAAELAGDTDSRE
jgi:hypothetical protein